MADLHKWQKGQVLQPKTDAITYSKKAPRNFIVINITITRLYKEYAYKNRQVSSGGKI